MKGSESAEENNQDRFVKFNVQAFQLEEEYTNEALTEILYISAKQELLNGRYICDIDLSVKLAALQMVIDLDPNEELDMETFGFVAFYRLQFSNSGLI